MSPTASPATPTPSSALRPADRYPPPRARCGARHLGAWARARLIPRSLRARIVGALLLAVVLAVVAETVSHMAEESARLVRELGAQADRVADGLRVELEQTVGVLDFELQAAADPRSPVGRSLSSGRVEGRFLGTQQRLQDGVLEVLKVLGSDGAILSSGHWPASFGALDPNVALYGQGRGRGLHVVDEPTPAGSAPALERWLLVRGGGREVLVVAGRFLDGPALERMRARTGADVVALCRAGAPAASPGGAPRLDAQLRAVGRARWSEGLGGDSAGEDGERDAAAVCLAVGGALGADGFNLDDKDLAGRFQLAAVDLGTHHLWVGLDRRSILAVRDTILRRALAVGIASIAFAMVLGALLAARITRPIERLAQAAGKLAAGDLGVRVDDDVRGGGSDVERLVTAFNRMAIDLEKNQTRLLQAERVSAWQEIARGLAHELKNPLTPILGAMDVVRKARRLDRPDFDAILEEQATAVVEEVMRLKELADAFARFARLPDRRPEPLRMSDVVDHAMALYAKDERLVVKRRYAEDLPLVLADKTQVGTVVTNLVKNAVEAMDGAGTLTVTLRPAGVAADESERVELVVADTGPGISPDVADRLFTPYVTTKGSRGTGLGLALAHRIVIEHGGSIEAGAAVGGGAVFTVRLPVRAIDVPAS